MKTKTLLTTLTLLISLQFTNAQQTNNVVSNQDQTILQKESDRITSASNNNSSIVSNQVTDNDLFDIQFTDNNHGWAVGSYGTVVNTINGGLSWSEYSFGPLVDLYDVHFIDNDIGFVVGISYVGPHLYGIVYKTDDGGQNWNLSYLSETPMVLKSIYFTNEQSGFLAGHTYGSSGNVGVILKTTDAGLVWETINSYTNITEFDNITFSNDDNYKGCVVGSATGKINIGQSEVSVVLKSVDMGATWNTTNTATNAIQYSDISFLDYFEGITVGEDGSILLTTNSGSSWNSQHMMNYSFNAALYVEPNYLITTGDNGAILSSYDKGQNWIIENSSITSDLNAICNTPGEYVWVAGNNGTLFHMQKPTSNNIIDKQNIDNRIEEERTLAGLDLYEDSKRDIAVVLGHSNYPNPFTNNTTISFELDKEAHAKLDIYNISGLFIETLVDQLLEKGNHEVKFDAQKLPSGMYRYILNTGSHVESGIMIK